jgi:hypothetical protein
MANDTQPFFDSHALARRHLSAILPAARLMQEWENKCGVEKLAVLSGRRADKPRYNRNLFKKIGPEGVAVWLYRARFRGLAH